MNNSTTNPHFILNTKTVKRIERAEYLSPRAEDISICSKAAILVGSIDSGFPGEEDEA